MIAQKLMMGPEEVVVPDVVPVVEGEGVEHPEEIYGGVIPVAMQVPRRVELGGNGGVVVFPVHPGPTYDVTEGTPLLQLSWVLELEGGLDGTQPNTEHW